MDETAIAIRNLAEALQHADDTDGPPIPEAKEAVAKLIVDYAEYLGSCNPSPQEKA